MIKALFEMGFVPLGMRRVPVIGSSRFPDGILVPDGIQTRGGPAQTIPEIFEFVVAAVDSAPAAKAVGYAYVGGKAACALADFADKVLSIVQRSLEIRDGFKGAADEADPGAVVLEDAEVLPEADAERLRAGARRLGIEIQDGSGSAG